MSKGVVSAILMCVIMVLVTAAPLAVTGTHYVTKGDQGPRANAVTWEYVPASYGIWTGVIINSGLRSLTVDVYDVTGGVSDQVMHQKIRFAAYDAYPTGVVETTSVVMGLNHNYSITVTPSGPNGSSCTVDDSFAPQPPTLVAVIDIVSVDYMTVVVDGSSSYDSAGTIEIYRWSFGDGSVEHGVTATHTYFLEGTYEITLWVMDDLGYTSTASETVTVHSHVLEALFTYTVDGLTVNVDASSSMSDCGIVSYDWDWGDGTTGNGMIASHTYAPLTSAPTVSQDLSGRSRFLYPPHAIFGFTYAADGVTALPGCIVTVTNTRTGETIVWDETRETWDPNLNLYFVDSTELMHGYYIGDLLNVTAIKGNFIGWTEAPVSDNGFDQIDVILIEAEGFMTVRITLTVTDTRGWTDSASRTMTLIAPPVAPVASFTYTVDGLTVNVDASASCGQGGIVSYAWDWGDGTTANGMIASHTYVPLKSALTASQDLTGKGRTTRPPHGIYGYTYAADGVTALPGCTVTVTDMRLGETIVWDETREYWDPNLNLYVVELLEFMGGYMIGDLLNVTATKGTFVGWAEAPVTDNGFDQIDVILSPTIVPMTVTITLTVTDMLGQTASVSQRVVFYP